MITCTIVVSIAAVMIVGMRMAERLALDSKPMTRAVIAAKRRILERDRLEWFKSLDQSPGRTQAMQRIDEKLLELADAEAHVIDSE